MSLLKTASTRVETRPKIGSGLFLGMTGGQVMSSGDHLVQLNRPFPVVTIILHINAQNNKSALPIQTKMILYSCKCKMETFCVTDLFVLLFFRRSRSRERRRSRSRDRRRSSSRTRTRRSRSGSPTKSRRDEK